MKKNKKLYKALELYTYAMVFASRLIVLHSISDSQMEVGETHRGSVDIYLIAIWFIRVRARVRVRIHVHARHGFPRLLLLLVQPHNRVRCFEVFFTAHVCMHVSDASLACVEDPIKSFTLVY